MCGQGHHHPTGRDHRPFRPCRDPSGKIAGRLRSGGCCGLQFFLGHGLPLKVLPGDPHLMHRNRKFAGHGDAGLRKTMPFGQAHTR